MHCNFRAILSSKLWAIIGNLIIVTSASRKYARWTDHLTVLEWSAKFEWNWSAAYLTQLRSVIPPDWVQIVQFPEGSPPSRHSPYLKLKNPMLPLPCVPTFCQKGSHPLHCSGSRRIFGRRTWIPNGEQRASICLCLYHVDFAHFNISLCIVYIILTHNCPQTKYCSEVETFFHMFWECPDIQEFWESLWAQVYRDNPWDIDLDPKRICWVLFRNNPHISIFWLS